MAYTTISSHQGGGQNWPSDWGTSGTLGIFCTRDFVADDGKSFQQSNADSLTNQFVTTATITIAANIPTYGSFTLPKTDIASPITVRYIGVIFDSSGVARDFLFSNFDLVSSLGDSITFLGWWNDNQQTRRYPVDTVPTTTQMNLAIVAAITAPATTTREGLARISVNPVDAAHPIAVGDNDTRNSNARTPTGAAGGELAGTYPNPTVVTGTGANNIVRLTAASKLPAVDGSLLTNLAISGLVTSVTPPNSPATGDYWLSLDVANVLISPRAADRDIALSPDQVWEQNGVAECNIYFASGARQMIYRGGNTAGRIGWATLVAGVWVKQNGSNPIIGGGAGGEAGNAFEPSIFVDTVNNFLYIYYTDNGVSGNVKVARTPLTNPASVTLLGTALAASGTKKYYNTSVIADAIGASGAAYVMAMDVGDSASTHPFAVGLATAASPTGPFTYSTTLSVFPPNSTSTSMNGGSKLTIRNGRYVLFTHGATSSPGAVALPTEGYRATSTNLSAWTQEPNTLIHRSAIREYDQIGDLEPYDDSRTVEFYWEGVNNAFPISPIAPASVATAWSYIMHARATPVMMVYDGTNWVKAPAVGTSSEMHIIAQTILGAAQTQIDIQNLDQDYDSLIIEVTGRGDAALTTIGCGVRVNNDSGANYYAEGFATLGSTAGANQVEAMNEYLATTSWARFGALTGASATAGRAGLLRGTILNYTNTTWHKNFQSETFNSYGTATTNQVLEKNAGVWANTGAINRLTFIPSSGNFVTGTVVTIYGVR